MFNYRYMFIGGERGRYSEIRAFDPTAAVALGACPIDRVKLEGEIKDCKVDFPKL